MYYYRYYVIMKTNRFFNLFLSGFITILLLISCGSGGTSDNNQSNSEYNYPEIAKYAEYINSIYAADDNLTGFWWDCSDIVIRKELYAHEDVIEGIMKCYEGRPTYHKQGEGYVEESAHTAVKNMKTGWNLGNTLDTHSYKALWDKSKNQWYDNFSNQNDMGWMLKYNVSLEEWEAQWKEPKTTNAMIKLVKDLGFDAVRMPVTWAEHLDKNNNIDSKWMARVKETADYIIANDMYCIVNIHHDGGADGWIKACDTSWNQYQNRFEKIWTQIAEAFKDYDERVIFESMNEVLNEKSAWAPYGNDLTVANTYINKWNKSFVSAVRATGGNNATRNLIVMTYAGASGSQFFNQGFELPDNTDKEHLIIEVHTYSPQAFTWQKEDWIQNPTAYWSDSVHGKVLDSEIGILSQMAEKYGVPIIIGEYAAFPKKYSEFQ